MNQQFSYQPFRHYEQNIILVNGIVFALPENPPIVYGNSGFPVRFDNATNAWILQLTDVYPFREDLTTTDGPDNLTCVSKGYADSFFCVAQTLGLFLAAELPSATVTSTPFILDGLITFLVWTYRNGTPSGEKAPFSFRIYASGMNNRVVRLPNGDLYG